MSAKHTTIRIGETLIKRGLISPEQLDIGLKEQKRTGEVLGKTMEKLGFIPPGAVEAMNAESTGEKGMVDIVPEEDAVKHISAEVAKEFHFVPVRVESNNLMIAMSDIDNIKAIDMAKNASGMDVTPHFAQESEVVKAINNTYFLGDTIDSVIDKLIGGNVDESGASITALVDKILSYAVSQKATDIHLAPEEQSMLIRARIDGDLMSVAFIPKKYKEAVVARVKILSGMDISERRKAQDGSFSRNIGAREFDIRTSSLPTKFGESIVMRMLDKSTLAFDLSNIGAEKYHIDIMMDVTKARKGMLLATGPTGSGKTTTLYSFLKNVNTLKKSVFTLEDPIEYNFPFVRQTEIDEKAGLSFGKGLAALLRQDPDIILVGEIRDKETASLAVNAALTGHFVLSTLHANESILTIQRLHQVGVEPYLIGSALKTIMSQRLVKTICQNCSEDHDIEDELKAFNISEKKVARLRKIMLDNNIEERPKIGKGCSKCNNTGMSNRTAIYEIFQLKPRHEDMIINNATPNELKKAAEEDGMITMIDDGIIKALNGKTTLKEVFMVLRD